MYIGLGNLLTKGGFVSVFPNKYSFNFDGSNNYLDCGLIDITVHTNATMACWIKLDNFDSTYMFAGCHNSKRFYFGITNGKVPFYGVANAVGSGGSALTINTGEWNHFALVADGGTATFYMNGIAKDTVSYTQSSATNPDHPFIVGARNDGGTGAVSIANPVNGCIDEFAIWSVALSADDIAKIGSKPVDFSKASTYATDRTSNLKLWLRAGDKVLPEEDKSIARSDFYTDFDGTDDFIDCGTSPLHTLSATTFTISCWIKVDNVSSDMNSSIGSLIADAPALDPTNGGFWLAYDDRDGTHSPVEGIAYNIKTSAGYQRGKSNNNVISSGVWHHIALVLNGQATLYIDGVSSTNRTEDNSGTLSTQSNELTIGSDDTNTYDFNGAISSASFYQTALDSQTISQMAKSRFTPMRDNRFSAVSFDGGDEYIAVPDNDSLDIGTGNVTVSAWVKPTDLDANYTILDKRGSDQLGILFLIHSGDRFFFQISDGTDDYYDYSGSLLTLGQWHHVCAVWNPSTTYAKFYLDGVDVGRQFDSTNANVGNSDNTSELRIGRASSGYTNNYFKGSISSVSLYNVEKSAEEVYAIYQQGITYDESSLSGLQGYWRMGSDTSKAYPTIADSSSNSNDGTMTAGQSTDIVQQMISGYDMGAFESSSEELGGDFARAVVADSWSAYANMTVNSITGGVSIVAPTTASGDSVSSNGAYIYFRGGAFFGENQLTTKDLTVGKTYSVTFNAFYSGGASGVYVDIYNSSSSVFSDALTTTNTSYTMVFEAKNATTGLLRFQQIKLDNTVYITDITVKEVLQSADLSDTYPAIIDVNEPVLGVEVNTVANATSPTNETNATTGWERSDTVNSTLEVVSNEAYSGNYSLKFTATTAGDMLNTASTFTVESGVLYKVSITWKSEGTEVNGFSMGWGTTKNGGDYVNQQVDESTDWVTTTNYIKTTTTTLGAFIHEGAGASDTKTIYIDSVTIKKVQGNVGTMTNQDSADLVYSSVLPDQSFLATGVNSAYNSFSFDGADQFIISSSNINITGSSVFSMGCWFKPTSASLTGFVAIIAFGDVAGHEESTLAINSGKLAWNNQHNNGDTYDTTTSLSADTWYHGLATFNGSDTVKLYLNGSLIFTKDDVSNVALTADPFYIGKRETGNNFTGLISQAKVWNKELSATEISAIYTLGRHGNLLDSYSDNLLGYYAMSSLDSVTGLSDSLSTIYDRSGNSNHGTPTNADAGDLKSSPNATPNGYSKGETNRSNNTP